MPKIVIGVCAYNEENNIRRLLQALLTEEGLPSNCRVLVVCSGCTDRTPEILTELHARYANIEPIFEKDRKGKASALNKIFKISRETTDVLILVNADALPQRGSVMKLVSQLVDKNVGAAFAQPVPFEGPAGISYKIVKVIWHLHHLISVTQNPKLSGELCAIRTSCLQAIPNNIATDEPYVELAIRTQRYRLLYVPEAIVHIRCPTNLHDLLKQRKRIWLGHMQLQKTNAYKVSTSRPSNTLRVISALDKSEIPFLLLGGFLEVIAYSQAKIESYKGRIPYAWEPIKSTKTSM